MYFTFQSNWIFFDFFHNIRKRWSYMDHRCIWTQLWQNLILSDQSIYFDSDFAPITDIDTQQRLLLNPVKMTADLKLDVSDPEFTDLDFRVYIDQDNILYEINQNFSQITGVTITPGIIAIYFYPEAEAITDQSITLKSIEHNGITYADGTYEIRYITQLK